MANLHRLQLIMHRPNVVSITGSSRFLKLFNTILLIALALGLAAAPCAFADEIAPRTPAPNFATNVWINSKPLTIKELRGKVVLVDFWEYTCINCIRTFPYLRRWNQLYGPDGLVVIGVHTPEFEFAKNPKNVANAVKRFGFTFPIAVDSDYQIWNAFQNSAWPADYLIDKNGNVAYIHFGEGDYGDFELEIRKLLKEANPKLNFAAAKYAIPSDANADMYGSVCRRPTPETYLGFARGANNANPGGEDSSKEVTYVAPTSLPIDSFALDGAWMANAESVRHTQPSKGLTDSVDLHYQAKAVYLVAGSDDGSPKQLFVTQDGKPLPKDAWGVDVKADPQGRTYINLGGKRMYYVAENPQFGDHSLGLYATEPGVSLYSFTFGNNCENKFAHN
jgi:thiol-disulfide isomerase/thioredoxin